MHISTRLQLKMAHTLVGFPGHICALVKPNKKYVDLPKELVRETPAIEAIVVRKIKSHYN